MPCPKCGYAGEADAIECAACGVIFSKLSRAAEPPPFPSVIAHSAEEDLIVNGRIGASELKILGFGLAAAIIVHAIPFLRAVFSAFVTLFHELGHAVVGWLMGYASIPAFDFVYGGGLTHHGPFRQPVAIAVAAAFAWLMWLFRDNRKSMAIIGALFVVWLFVVTKEWRRETAFAAAGHFAELILAGILFYKALAGVGWRIPEIERPLGAFIAFFVQIHSMLFARRLATDVEFLSWYREGKGGALMNDLEVVALNLHIWTSFNPGIEGIARALLLFSSVPTVVALIWYFERARWHRVLRALRTAEA